MHSIKNIGTTKPLILIPLKSLTFKSGGSCDISWKLCAHDKINKDILSLKWWEYTQVTVRFQVDWWLLNAIDRWMAIAICKTPLWSTERASSSEEYNISHLSKVVFFCGNFECTSKGYIRESNFSHFAGEIERVIFKSLLRLWQFWMHQGVCREGNFSNKTSTMNLADK